jgi:NAD(P)H-hydrate repair Nnr-like enzyme with NAD(P)H-hydrate epimerase domain
MEQALRRLAKQLGLAERCLMREPGPEAARMVRQERRRLPVRLGW